MDKRKDGQIADKINMQKYWTNVFVGGDVWTKGFKKMDKMWTLYTFIKFFFSKKYVIADDWNVERYIQNAI